MSRMDFGEANVATGKNILDNNFTTVDPKVANVTLVLGTPGNSTLNYAALGTIPIIIFVAMGNILVIIAVWLDTKLRSATNCFLSSLAVADLLVALTVMIPSLAMIVNNYEWPFSDVMCGIWVMLDVFFSTSSIFHLCMVSFDRYVALARPFHYRNTSGGGNARMGKLQYLVQRKARTLRRVAVRILLVWAVALSVAIPIPILGMINRENLFNGKMCSINIPNFQIFGSLVAFFLPLVIMFVMYTLTIRTLRQQAKLVSGMLVHNCKKSSLYLSHKSSHRRHAHQPASTDNLGCRKCASTSSQYQQRDQGQSSQQEEESPTDSRESEVVCRQLPNGQYMCKSCDSSQENGANTSSLSTGLKRVTKALRQIQSILRSGSFRTRQAEISSQHVKDADAQQSLSPEQNTSDRERTLLARKQRSSVRQVSSSFKKKAMASITNEQRASKVLGLIFVLFCLFWCPFFVTNVLSRLCSTCNQELMGQLMNWFVWVGYVSSGVNPIVYTMFSRRFRDTFHLLLRCRIREIYQNKFARNVSSQENSGSSVRSARTTAGSGQRRSSRTSLRLTASHWGKKPSSRHNSGEDVRLNNTRIPISEKIASWKEQIQQNKKDRSESENTSLWRSSMSARDDIERHTTTTANGEGLNGTSSYSIHSASKKADKELRRLSSENDAVSSVSRKDSHPQFELQTITAEKIVRLASLPRDKTWLNDKDNYSSSDDACSSLDSVWSNNFGGTSPSRDLQRKGAFQASRKNNNTNFVCKRTSSTLEKDEEDASVANKKCVLPECGVCFKSSQELKMHKLGGGTQSESESFFSNRKTKFIKSGKEKALPRNDIFTFVT